MAETLPERRPSAAPAAAPGTFPRRPSSTSVRLGKRDERDPASRNGEPVVAPRSLRPIRAARGLAPARLPRDLRPSGGDPERGRSPRWRTRRRRSLRLQPGHAVPLLPPRQPRDGEDRGTVDRRIRPAVAPGVSPALLAGTP